MASITRRRTASGESRWDVRYRVAGRCVTQTFKRRQDADAHKRKVEYGELHGDVVDPRGARITFDDWWKRWWPTTVGLRASTRDRAESIYKVRLSPAFGSVNLDQIDREAVRRWIADLQNDELAPATIHKAVQTLSKALRAAVNDGRLHRNPAERLELPRIEREEMRFLTPIEVATLADTIDPAYKAFVILGAYGGLRRGEMLALRRKHIDLLHAKVEIVATLVELSGRLHENPPKTKAGRRTVPIPNIVVMALSEHLALSPGEPDDYLFTAPMGGPVRSAAWRTRVWDPATKRAGLTPLRVHDLRHTAVALWIAAGANPKEVAARAGHTSVVTVLDRYGHLLPGSEDRVTNALDALAASYTEPRTVSGLAR
jgi:integrase